MRAGSPATVLAWTMCVAATASAPVAAHRIDEYLQAVRIDLGLERVGLHIDLTPGADIADSVFAALDSNGDREIAPAEADGYATLFLNHLTVSVDGEARPLMLVSRQFPSVSEMRAGTGVIRIEAIVTHARSANGRHRLELHNNFRPDVGVYLVNPLMPGTSAITIVDQRRDPLQRTLTLDYDIANTQGLNLLSWSVVAAGIIGLALGRRRGMKKVKT